MSLLQAIGCFFAVSFIIFIIIAQVASESISEDI